MNWYANAPPPDTLIPNFIGLNYAKIKYTYNVGITLSHDRIELPWFRISTLTKITLVKSPNFRGVQPTTPRFAKIEALN